METTEKQALIESLAARYDMTFLGLHTVSYTHLGAAPVPEQGAGRLCNPCPRRWQRFDPPIYREMCIRDRNKIYTQIDRLW